MEKYEPLTLDWCLRKLFEFKDLTPEEISWYINELHRRFRWPIEELVKLFEAEGFKI